MLLVGILIEEKAFFIMLVDFGRKDGFNLTVLFDKFVIELVKVIVARDLGECLLFDHYDGVTAEDLLELPNPIGLQLSPQ